MEEEDPVGAIIGGCDPKGNALADNRPLYGGCSYVGYLTTFKNIQPETNVFGISMEKYFDNGLFLYLGYAHTDREMAHMMTSSIIFSSAVRMPVFDHLTPVNSRSHYEIEHSFDYALIMTHGIPSVIKAISYYSIKHDYFIKYLNDMGFKLIESLKYFSALSR